MQRNQTTRLEAWLNHHGYLAGFENLTVFDNGSTDRETIRILRRFADVGTRVIWEHRERSDLAARDLHFENLTRQWSGSDYTFAVRLECEEWLASFSRNGLSCRRDEIGAYLDALYRAGERFLITAALQPDPARSGFFQLAETTRPVIAASVDGVNAAPSDGAPHPTELAVVRMTGAESTHSGAVLVGFPALAWLGLALGTNASLFPDPPGETAPDVLPILLPLMRGRKRVAAAFDGASYLELNPDVAAASWPALKHFMLHGSAEGRRIE